MFSIYKEGFLQKQGKRKVQGYKKRWFVLSGNIVKYYPSQDTSENSVLGVIDMARVVSVKASKHVKHGFEISTEARTYYLAAKATDEKDEWMRIILQSVEATKKTSVAVFTDHSILGTHSSEEAPNTYQVVGSTNRPYVPGYDTYDIVSGDRHSGQSITSQQYIKIGEANKQAPYGDTAPTYQVLGENAGTDAANSSIAGTATYDTIPIRTAHDIEEAAESIYDTVGGTPCAPVKTPSPSTRRLPLNDQGASERDMFHENEDGLSLKMSSLMSKLSVESLDSIDSLDLTELTDDELQDDETDGEVIVDNGKVKLGDESALPPPLFGTTYACNEIRNFIKNQGRSPAKVDFARISKEYKLDLETKSDYPAFDALRKVFDVYKLKPTT
eukprot:gene9507-17244_t